eukprot:jgi/Mesvir1/19023/Mv12790-RA.1
MMRAFSVLQDLYLFVRIVLVLGLVCCAAANIYGTPGDIAPGVGFRRKLYDASSASAQTTAQAAAPRATACPPSTLPGTDCSVLLLGGRYILSWAVGDNGLAIAVDAATTGWVGFGFSPLGAMVGSDAVIGWVPDDGSPVSVAPYSLTAMAVPGVIRNENVKLLDTSAVQTQGRTLVRFRYPFGSITHRRLLQSIFPVNISKTHYIVVAMGPDGADHLAYHGFTNRAVLRLTFDYTFTNGSSGGGTPEVVVVVQDGLRRYRKTHGVLMAIGWGILLPLGILVARFGKRWDPAWFHVHRVLQVLGLTFGTIGFIIALNKFPVYFTQFTHGRLGFGAMMLGWAQLLIGVLRPHKEQQGRLEWEFLHVTVGRVAVVLASVAIFYGFQRYQLLYAANVKPTPVVFDDGWMASKAEEIGYFSKYRLHLDESRPTRDSLRECHVQALQETLPRDLNDGYDKFVDRDRQEVHPAPLDPIVSSLCSFQKTSKLVGRRLVTWRGNLVKIMCTPWDTTPWHIELQRVKDTIFFNVVEPPMALLKEQEKTDKQKLMCFWGYKFEQLCAQPHGEPEGPVDVNAAYCTIVRRRMGFHEITMAGEVDCCEGPPQGQDVSERYLELKTHRAIHSDKDAENFYRRKMMKIWAQSWCVGVPKVLVGFRDDNGMLQSLQVLETNKLPHMMAVSSNPWNASHALAYLDMVLSWLWRTVLRETPLFMGEGVPTGAGQSRFRLEFDGMKGRPLRLVCDPSIPPFIPRDGLMVASGFPPPSRPATGR